MVGGPSLRLSLPQPSRRPWTPSSTRQAWASWSRAIRASCRAVAGETTVSQALDAAAEVLQPGLNEAAQLDARVNPPEVAAPGALNLTTIDPGLPTEMAQKIIISFANANFNTIKQATAVATAKHESGLIPTKINPVGEHSVGLFQLNTQGSGRGSGHDDAELKDT